MRLFGETVPGRFNSADAWISNDADHYIRWIDKKERRIEMFKVAGDGYTQLQGNHESGVHCRVTMILSSYRYTRQSVPYARRLYISFQYWGHL